MWYISAPFTLASALPKCYIQGVTTYGLAVITHTLVHDTHQCSFPLHETALPLLWANLRPNQQFAGSFIPVVSSLPSSHPHFRAPTEACSGSCCEDLAFADSDAIFCLVESFLCSQNQSYQGCGYLLDHFSKFLPSVASAIPSSCTENFMQD